MGDAFSPAKAAGTQYWRPRRLGHCNIFIGSYERAAEYYSEVVGFREVYRQPNNMATFMSNGNTYHDLGLTDIHSRYCKPGQQPDLWHVAFEVESEADLVEGYDRAVQAGVTFKSTEDHDVARSLYFIDPDGLLVEVYADVMDDWRSHRKGIINKEKPKYVPGVTSKPIRERLYPKNPELDVVKEAVFHPKRVTHAALVTEKFEDLFRFYTGIIGLTPFVGDENAPFAILRGTVGSCDLTLFRSRQGVAPGFHHTGFEVWDEADLDRSIAALAARGIEAERIVDHPARRAVTIRDPDGIRLQFYVNRKWTPEVVRAVDAQTAPHLL
jgi:catechol 2,3-dioxygenase